MLNPIESRLQRLYAQWAEFVVEERARVLRWLVLDDEVRMVETFIGVECSGGGRLPALFARLSLPFTNENTYAADLRGELLAQLEREAEDEEALRGFTAPAPRPDNAGIDALVEAAEALTAHIRDQGVSLEHVALCILPPPIGDPAAWASFVQRLATRLRTSEIRGLVVDRTVDPVLEEIASAEPVLIHSVAAELDMSTAVLEISARVGDLDTPPGKFRHAYAEMLGAVEAQDLQAAQQYGAKATAVATAQGWWHLVMAVPFCIGTGFLTAKKAADAVRWFRLAEEPLNGELPPTGAGDEADAALVRSLRLKCRLGMAAACYFAGAMDKAAQTYAGAADIAAELEDRLAEVDARRMQSHCHERAGALEDAWKSGLAGLGTGAKVPEADRKMSTLPHLGHAMVALTKRGALSHRRAAITAHLEELLGKGWEVS